MHRKVIFYPFFHFVDVLCWIVSSSQWIAIIEKAKKLESEVLRMTNFSDSREISFRMLSVKFENKKNQNKNQQNCAPGGNLKKYTWGLHKNIRWLVQKEQKKKNSRRSIVQDRYDEIDLCWVYGEAGREWKEDEQEKSLNYVQPNANKTANEVK